MPNARFSQFLDRWMNRVRGSKKQPSRKPRKWPQLMLETYEDRLVPAVLPTPVSSQWETIASGYDPSVAIDPANSNRMVLASTNGVNVEMRISEDGGASWARIFLSALTPPPPGNNGATVPFQRILNPALNPISGPGFTLPRLLAYTNASNPTVTFSQPDPLNGNASYIYLSHLETDNSPGKLNGALVVHKFTVSSGTVTINDLSPTTDLFSDGKVVYQWANQDPILNPTIAIDNNIRSFKDFGQDDTDNTNDVGERLIENTLSSKAVYVAWNTNATPTQLPVFVNTIFNPNKIFVAASSDGGFNFTNSMPVDDDGYIADTVRGTYGATTPQIVFSPGGNATAPGQLAFAWSSTRNGNLTIDRSFPDLGNATAPIAGSQRFVGTGGFITDASPGTAPPLFITPAISPVRFDPFVPTGTAGYLGSILVTFNAPVVANTFTSTVPDVISILNLTNGANITANYQVVGIDLANNTIVTGANTTNTFLIQANQPLAHLTSVTLAANTTLVGVGNGTVDIRRTTFFPQVILPGSITDPLTRVTDLNVSLDLKSTNLDEVAVQLLYFAGNTTVTEANIRAGTVAPTRRVLLFQNRQDEGGNATTPTGQPTRGLPSAGGSNATNLGAFRFPTNGGGFVFNTVGTTFDQQAPRPINDPANIQPYVGSFSPEFYGGFGTSATYLDSNGFVNIPFSQLSGFNTSNATQLVGTWVLAVNDYRSDGNQSTPPRPLQQLGSWSLNFTSHINSGLGTDSVATGLLTPSIATGTDTIHPTRIPVAPTPGIGSGASIAVDNTVGSFSPFAGRMYMAYTTGTANETNINLLYSTNGGGTWIAPIRALNYPRGQLNLDNLSDNFSEGNRYQFQPNVTVDSLTGTVVVTWYDARIDAQNRRVATYMATSIDGGVTFSEAIPVNQPYRVFDPLVNGLRDLEPITSNFTTVGNTGFGENQAVVAVGGRINMFWSGNDNGNTLDVKSSQVRLAGGPRVIYADGGPIIANATNPLSGAQYNRTLDANGSFSVTGDRMLEGFSIVFDRPVAINSFVASNIANQSNILLYYLPPGGNPLTGGGVRGNGTLVTLANVTAVSPPPLSPPVPAGTATTFFVSLATPTSTVGTYSYMLKQRDVTVGNVTTPVSIRDALRNPYVAATSIIGAGSSDTPKVLNFFTRRVESIISHPGLPAGRTVDNAIVRFSMTHTNSTALQITLISPTGAQVTLFDSFTNHDDLVSLTNWGAINPFNTVFDNVLFHANAAGDVSTLTQILDPVTLELTYTGNVTMDGPGNLATTFDGLDAAGNWTLRVDDFSDLATSPFVDTTSFGSLDSWSLTVEGSGGITLDNLRLGNPTDQDGDSLYGEPNNDQFSAPGSNAGAPLILPYASGSLPLIIPGPRVLGTSNATIVGSSATSIVVNFDRSMNPATFTPVDVLRLSGPAGVVAGAANFTVSPVAGTANRSFRITFPRQIAGGSYSLELGSNIQSAAGDLMDANLNAGVDRLFGGNPLTATTLNFSTYATPVGPAASIQPRATVSLPLNIPDSFVIQQNANNKIELRLSITYAQPSDLYAELVSPSGRRVRLFTSPGPKIVSSGNFSNTLLTDLLSATSIQDAFPQFDNGPYSPQFPLGALIGDGSQGNWRLEVTNLGSGSGSIDALSLKLPFANSSTGLGDGAGDNSTIGFRISNLNPTDEYSRDVWSPVGATQVSQVQVGLPGTITNRVGRVTAIAADPSDPSGNTVYVGSASGGIWKTTNFLTTDAGGPTYVPLTDFGAVGSLAIGSIVVIPRNNNPLQSLVFATTGNAAGASPNISIGNVPGVGMIRSNDGGRTWRIFDSTVNVDSLGNPLPFNSSLRDHLFVGATAFKLIVDPHTDSFGNNILYMAVSGNANNRGVWRSLDGGGNWTRILIGNASDLAFAAASKGVDGTTQIMYVSVNSVGVFLASNAPTASAATVLNPNGSFNALNGGSGNPLIRNASVVTLPPLGVNNPPTTPTGAPGFIKIGVPALTGNPLQDDYYLGWIYAMTSRGLYMSKDFGANWTFLQIPRLPVGVPIPVLFPSNNETLPDQDVDGNWTAFGYDLFVDPTNPNIVYAGGEVIVKLDTTFVKDPYSFTTQDYSDSTGSPRGGISTAGGSALVFDPIVRGFIPAPGDFINLRRDPTKPFVSPSSILVNVSNPTNFLNNGANVKWQFLTNFLETDTRRSVDGIFTPGRGIQDLIGIVDPLTKQTRLMYGTEGGVYSVLDAETARWSSGFGNSTQSVGGALDSSIAAPGFLVLPAANRNGSLQISQFISGAVQPSQFAADIANAMFYAISPAADIGAPVSSSNAVTSGSPVYFNNTDAGTWVGVDPSGAGNAYQFQAGLNYLGVTSTDFFRFIGDGNATPDRGGISRTNGLFTPGGATGGTAQWQQLSFFPGFLPAIPTFGQATINDRDPNALMLGSGTGRVYRTTDKGKNWFQVAAPADVGSSPANALAFGAPNSSAAAGPIIGTNNFLYAGNQVGRIYITLQGGAPWKVSAPLTLPNGTTDNTPILKIIASPVSGRFDAYAVTRQGVYYLADARVATPTWTNISGNIFSVPQTIYGVAGDTFNISELTAIAVDWRGIGGVPNDSNTPQPAILYVGSEGAVFRSRNAGAAGGTTWSLFPNVIGDGAPADGGYLPRNRVTDLDLSIGNIDPTTGQPKKDGSGLNLLLATTYGRGQFAIRLDNALPINAFVSGPRVNTTTNTSVPGTPRLRLVFTGPVLNTSFDQTDVTLVPNSGNSSISAISVTPVPNIVGGADLRDTFDIVFATPVNAGNYTLTIGQDITDLAGNKMNQNNNSVNGEAGDSYRQQLIVTTATPFFTVLARIAGTAYLDFNADGIRQAAEPGISGRTIYLDLDNSGNFTTGDLTRVTDSAGRYDFGNFTANTYRVREILFGAHSLTGNAAAIGGANVTLSSGNDQTAIDIGHRLSATIYPTRATNNLFSQVFPNSNTAYVFNVFRSVLGQDPTASELTFHVNALNSGYNRIDYATSIYNRNESLFFQVDKIYQTVLKRPADAAGLAFWSDQFRRGLKPEWLVVQLMTANEYQTSHASNASFITGIYNDILGRSPTAGDISFWNNFLATRSRFDLAFAFAYSTESYTRAVQDVFVQYLHREATTADINNWVPLLVNRRLTVSRMMVLLISSAEFGNKALNATG